MHIDLNSSIESLVTLAYFLHCEQFLQLYYVHIEETFDVIKRAHIATGHGARDRMLKELGKKYANVTRDSIELFKSFSRSSLCDVYTQLLLRVQRNR
jgi:hypothetical protein